jgi:hypothetical protein
VQLPPAGDDVTVYEDTAPPPLPGATTTVAPLSTPVTDEIIGADGDFNFHCAIKVELALPIFVGYLAGYGS